MTFSSALLFAVVPLRRESAFTWWRRKVGVRAGEQKKTKLKLEMVMVAASRLSCYCPNHAKLCRRDAFGQMSMVDLEVWPVVEEERRSQSRSRFTMNRAKLRLISLFLQESDTEVPSMQQHLCGCRARYPGVWEPRAISNICNMSGAARTTWKKEKESAYLMCLLHILRFASFLSD